jgi:NAD(P)-dependent dehydrogenase (short-subunit alcohol dehydrogenase family)
VTPCPGPQLHGSFHPLPGACHHRIPSCAIAQVVNLSSVTHRYGWVGDVASFLPSWCPGSYYPATKLANCLFAFELQRRLGRHGVQVGRMHGGYQPLCPDTPPRT